MVSLGRAEMGAVQVGASLSVCNVLAINRGGLLLCVKLVKIAVEYYAFLSRPILWKAAPILLTLPSSWIAYYWLHRRFKRLSEEVPSSSQRLVKEAQRLMIAFTLVVYILFGSGLRIIDYLLEQLYH